MLRADLPTTTKQEDNRMTYFKVLKKKTKTKTKTSQPKILLHNENVL